MKKSIYAVLALMPWMLASCTGSSGETANSGYFDDVEYMPVQLESDGAWSFISPDGEISLEDEFKSDCRVSAVVNGYFSVKDKNGVTVYKYDKRPDVVGDLEDLVEAGAFNDGVMPVTRKLERISIVNTKGESVASLEPVNGKEIIGCDGIFSQGLLLFYTEDGKSGYVNTKGEVVIAPTWDGAITFSNNGYAAAYKTNADDGSFKWSIIDKKGDIVVSLKKGYNYSGMYKKTVLVNDGSRYGLMSFDGEVRKLPAKYTLVGDWNDDYIIVATDYSNWGVVKNNENFEVVIKPKYDVLNFAGDKFLAKKGDKEYALVDTNGERVFDFDDCDGVNYVNSKWKFIVDDGREHYFVNADGKSIGKEEFSNISGNKSISGNISSNYFNVDAFVSEIGNLISAKGIGDYKIGSPTAPICQKLGLNPETYTYTYTPYSDPVKLEGYKYSISYNFVSVSALADWRYNDPYSYYDYSRTYYWNDTTIESVDLSATANCANIGKDVFDQLVKAIEKKGFKVSQKDDTSAEFLNNGIRLFMNVDDGYDSTSVNIHVGEYAAVETVDAFESY